MKKKDVLKITVTIENSAMKFKIKPLESELPFLKISQKNKQTNKKNRQENW